MMQAVFEQALGISEPWYVKEINFSKEDNQLDIHIDFKRGTKFVNAANELCPVHDTVKKTWQHLNFFQHQCYLHARVPRIKDQSGKVSLVKTPWEGRMSGLTLLFEALLIQLSMAMPISQVRKLTGISDYTLWSMLDKYVDTARSELDLSDIECIGMDETSIAKGHDYITLFVDLANRRTIHISQGKDSQTVTDFVDHLQKQQGKADNIKQVSCDMSPAFIKGVTEQLPDAQITFDKFHIVKIINDAVDAVRREEAKDNPLLKGSRYVFLKNTNNLTSKQQATKIQLSTLNLKSMRALAIRESFQQLYALETKADFEQGLNQWYYWATHSQLPPMIKAAKTIKRHWHGILAWMQSKINNGILEGLNSVLQAAKRKARGYKAKHFKTIAFLLTGKLDFSNQNQYLPT